MSDKIPPTCVKFASTICDLNVQLAALQKGMANAVSASEKQATAAKINGVLQKLTAEQSNLNKCQKTADLLNVCPSKPDSFYRLPFPADPDWQLWNGNWDDPKAGHNKGNPNGLQAHAFDFVPVGPNGQGEASKKVLAARPGKVVVAVSSELGNSWGVNNVYFFKGTEYLKYDVGKDKVYPNYPENLDANHWRGWPADWTSIDAAVNWGNGTAFFFHGGSYLKYDIAKDQVFPGYPAPLNSSRWKGWPASWNSGVDAAINWGNGKVYFFKGPEYLRYDIASDQVDPNYPRALNSSNWPGWPSGWETGIDAAVNWTFGHAYFFKKNHYIRYVMSPAPDHVDGSPQLLDAAHWSGWPATWTTGIDAAVVWDSGYLGVGNHLVIEHADGTFGVYWHFEQNGVRVKVGDIVERGDWVGLSGSTGNASTSHLHFDVRTGWDFGYPASRIELPSIPVRFQTEDHNCWLPRTGDVLISNNSEKG